MEGSANLPDPGPAIGEFAPVPGTMAEYEMGSDLTRVFADPPRGLVVHYAGPIDDLVLSGSLWARRQSALDFFSERVGDALTELVRRLMSAERDPDLSYELLPVDEIVVGPAAPDFVLRPRGEAGGAVLVRTPGGAMPDPQEQGLILAAARRSGPNTMLYEFHADRPDSIDERAELITLHSIFLTEPGLAAVSGRSA
ncbi:MAG: hypothetical protein QM648_05110 [Solirubrobacterales bacterium]